MQPLISPVDHEARHNSFIRDNASEPSESTPLLTHQFARNETGRRSTTTTVVVTILLFILISGVIIGTYLLIEQQRALPVDIPFLYVKRAQWDSDKRLEGVPLLLGRAKNPASHVVIVDTNTEECSSSSTCQRLLQSMQVKAGKELPFNFLISSNGQTYEGLGWRRTSTLVPQLPRPVLVLAFMGNFSSTYPNELQLNEAQVFIEEAISRHQLRPSYTLIGKNLNHRPSLLYRELSRLPEWDWSLSDPIY